MVFRYIYLCILVSLVGCSKPKEELATKALDELPGEQAKNSNIKNSSVKVTSDNGPALAGRDLEVEGSFEIVDASPDELIKVPVVVLINRMVNGKPVVEQSHAFFVERGENGAYLFKESVSAKHLKPGKYELSVMCKDNAVISKPLVLETGK